MAQAVKRRLKSVKVTLRLPVTDVPVAGSCTYRRGKLVYVASGAFEIDGRVSNFFDWRIVQKDGTLGRWQCGYWHPLWSKE